MATFGSLYHLFDESGIATEDWWAPVVRDQIFTSNPTALRLRQNARTIGGGANIMTAMIHSKNVGGGWHGEWDLYSNPYSVQLGAGRLNWKLYQEPVILSHLELLINANNPTQRFALAEQKNYIAAKTASDAFGTALFATTRDVQAIDSLDIAVSDYNGTYTDYAEITRAATGPEAVWNSNVDSTTTVTTLGAIQTEYGLAQEGDEKVNLMVTTQTIFNKVYNLMTPMQRLGSGLLGEAGFSSLLVNGVPIVVDSHVADYHLYGFNMNHIELVAHSMAFWVFERAQVPTNQWVHIGRYHFVGNVVCHAPRYQFKFTALAA